MAPFDIYFLIGVCVTGVLAVPITIYTIYALLALANDFVHDRPLRTWVKKKSLNLSHYESNSSGRSDDRVEVGDGILGAYLISLVIGAFWPIAVPVLVVTGVLMAIRSVLRVNRRLHELQEQGQATSTQNADSEGC